MKKVLIAIDYNPCAQKIAETGYAYAKKMNAETCIVHVVADIAYYAMEYLPIMGFEGFSADGPFRNVDEQKKEATDFLDAVVRHLGDSNIKIMVLEGTAADAIVAYAIELDADLIIMGTQSHNGFEKLLMGNVAANVLKQSTIPILIVPTDIQDLDMISERQTMFLQI